MEKQTENRLMDMGRGEKRVRCMERETWKLTLRYVKYIANGNLHIAQEIQTGALCQPGGWNREGG